MPGNTSSIWIASGKVGNAKLTAANTKSDGTGTIGTDISLLLTAGSNGTYVQKIVFAPTASVAATSVSATVLRAYISTVTSGATANTNTFLIGEVAWAATAVDNTTSANYSFPTIIVDQIIPSGYTILVSSHIVAATNTAWQVTCWGGDY